MGASKERFEVEWCSDMPVTEWGDADVDRATYTVHHAATESLAMAFVKSLLTGNESGGEPVYGVCKLTRQEAELDDDLLEHEGIQRMVWVDRETVQEFYVDDDLNAPLVWERCG